MDEIIKGLMPWAIVPLASIAVAGYVISAMIGLHRTKAQQRNEFLGLWRGVGQMDDMSLEVSVRHLCGTYLPARIIRRLCSTDHCADGVFQVAQLWSLLRYDVKSGCVSWAKPAYAARKGLLSRWLLCTGAYFCSAFVALGFLAAALGGRPASLLAWLFGANFLLFSVVAFGFLAKAETFAYARKHGECCLERIVEPPLEALPVAAATTNDSSPEGESAPERGRFPIAPNPLSLTPS